jgi:phage-related protein
MSPNDKPLSWLYGEVKTPPFSKGGRLEAGFLLRRLQRGELLSMPHSRPMPSIGARCHELRVNDSTGNWRIVYRVDSDAIVIAEVFAKTTQKTPKTVIDTCKRRLKDYDYESEHPKKTGPKGLESRKRKGIPGPKRR